MKRTWAAAAIVSAALAALPPVRSRLFAAPAATQPAAVAQTDVPVKQVVLFSSGVGYFEHFGSVRDNGATELRFKTDQINDVLKSLVLQDLDKGSVGAVTYPSQEPIEKTLKSFQVNITTNPPLADLLNQLRGAKITVSPIGPAEQEMHGTIVGVERRQERVTSADGRPQVVDTWVLNLKVGHRFHALPMSQVKDFSLDDPKLEEELDKALSALAQSRDQDKKPVTINFRGQGERRVRIGYVVETPIWKTSYRLIMDNVPERPAAKPAADAGFEKAAAPVAGGPLTAEQKQRYQAESQVLHSWAELAAPQYGASHPSVDFIATRAKAIDAALAKNQPPAAPAAPKPPKDAVERRDLEDELEVHKQWYDGMAKGYGVDNPGIATVRDRMQKLEAILSERAVPAAAKLPAAGAGVAAPAGKGTVANANVRAGKLQGWAIVENQTDNDWNDVQLSLVSGRPLSNIQDLYHPLYIPRPVVFPNLYASLRPQTYQGGITEKEEQALNERRNAQQNEQAAQNQRGGRGGQGQAGGGGGSRGNALFANNSPRDQTTQNAQPMDPTASVVSAASAADLGELFEYTVGNVSLPRQRSAMIPIVTDEVEIEKVSIYNAEVLPTHPLTGAKVKNTTKKHLLAGPVTVLEGGSYAGDARIDDVPPGQSRYLSYGIDLNVVVDPQAESPDSGKQSIRSAKITKGVLEIVSRNQAVQTYKVQNKGDTAKTVIIEHPREADWRVVEPAKVEETTEEVHRLRLRVDAHKTESLTVLTEGDTASNIQLMRARDEDLLVYAKDGSVPPAVRTALEKVIGMNAALADTQREIGQRKTEIAEVTTEQQRLRENMKTVAQNTDYYTRLLTKLNDQETRIEQLQKEIGDFLKTQKTQQKALAEFIAKLEL